MEATSKPKFVYVTYITTTPEKLWEALTSGEFTKKYWFGSRIESDWKVGSPFTIYTGVPDKDWKGKVLQCQRFPEAQETAKNGNFRAFLSRSLFSEHVFHSQRLSVTIPAWVLDGISSRRRKESPCLSLCNDRSGSVGNTCLPMHYTA